ncbi:TolC family protein, partial [Acinetobacter baumannii]
AATYLTLTGNVAVQVITIAGLRGQIDAVNEIVAADQQNLDLVQAQVRAGTGTDVDLETARSQLANDRTLLPPLRQQLSAARHRLAV